MDEIILQGSNHPSTKELPIDDLLLRALTSLNPGEWVRYQEMELKPDEMELKELTTFGTKYFVRLMSIVITDDLPKMVKCALTLSHSNIS